jgi:hypothetical protein
MSLPERQDRPSPVSGPPNPQRMPDPRSVYLTPEDVSLLIDRAMTRHRDAQERAGQVTLADAVEIARQLDIPEEHLLAAAAELPHLRRREEWRGKIRRRLRYSAMWGTYGAALSTAICTGVAIAIWAVYGNWWGLATVVSLLPLMVLSWIYVGWHLWYCLRRPISDAQVDRAISASPQDSPSSDWYVTGMPVE